MHEGRTDGWRVFKFPLSLSISSAWVRVKRAALSKFKTQFKVKIVSQVVVQRSVVKVRGFAYTPPSPSVAGGGRCGGLWDAGG